MEPFVGKGPSARGACQTKRNTRERHMSTRGSKVMWNEARRWSAFRLVRGLIPPRAQPRSNVEFIPNHYLHRGSRVHRNWSALSGKFEGGLPGHSVEYPTIYALTWENTGRQSAYAVLRSRRSSLKERSRSSDHKTLPTPRDVREGLRACGSG